jgi:AcrR family transcriptional regulator
MAISRNTRQGARADSARSVRNRGALLRAGRAVFEEDGFVNARLSDITDRAGLAQGTFYNYFNSKAELLAELVDELLEDLAREVEVNSAGLDFAERIDRVNRAYIGTYRRHAKLMAVLEQAATVDDQFREKRRSLRAEATERTERALRHLQESGQGNPELDIRIASAALIAMTDNFLYVWLSLGEPFEEENVAPTLQALWLGALGLTKSKS